MINEYKIGSGQSPEHSHTEEGRLGASKGLRQSIMLEMRLAGVDSELTEWFTLSRATQGWREIGHIALEFYPDIQLVMCR